MASAAPTRRELVLVTLLLAFLLLISRPSNTTNPTQTGHNTYNTSAANGSPQAYHDTNTRLTWGSSPVPQTKVLAHVPGMWMSALFPTLACLTSTA